MGSKKTKKVEPDPQEVVNGYMSLTLPFGCRTNASNDVGLLDERFGEFSWWMSPEVLKRYSMISEEGLVAINEMLSAVVWVTVAAMSGEDEDADADEVLVKVMKAITSAAYNANEIVCAAHYAGIQFEQKYPEMPPAKLKSKSK
jgi:hypothetical protein